MIEEIRKQAKELKKVTGAKLTVCQNLAAKVHGYKDWDHLVRIAKKDGKFVSHEQKVELKRQKRRERMQ